MRRPGPEQRNDGGGGETDPRRKLRGGRRRRMVADGSDGEERARWGEGGGSDVAVGLIRRELQERRDLRGRCGAIGCNSSGGFR